MSYNPTHVVVAVQRARDLKAKGSNNTNDAFVTIALDKNKFQTTVKDGAIDPEWYEECDLPLPEDYDEQKLVLQVFHRNKFGIDEFLGHLELPLQNFDVYDAPRSNWYPLSCKPGQNKTNPRGELEVRVGFDVKKIQDFDAMSTASAKSKRFKMSKIKHAAGALGRKIKGPKHKETTDFIPDLTGDLDSGALDLEDIAENYAAEPEPAVSSKRKSSHTDSLTTSPIFKRNPNARGSKGLSSPFINRRSRADTDTSSLASNDEYKQKANDNNDSSASPFTKTHRRGGSSGSDAGVSGKPPKVNRRILTSKIKAQSTYDVSSTGQEFDATPDRSALDDMNRPRTRSSLSNTPADPLPEVQEGTKEQGPDISSSSKRLSSVSSSKVADKPVLIDDDSDESGEEFSPSPVAPVTVRKEEPTDLFARVEAQMQKEQEDEFSLVKHEAEPGENVFTPVGNLNKTKPQAAATSTPIAAEPVTVSKLDVVINKPPSGSKSKSKTGGDKSKPVKSKAAPPPTDVFDLLMASDEPEYNVDDTLPNKEKSANPFGGSPDVTDKNVNPFVDVESPKVDSSNPFSTSKSEPSNPFGDEELPEDKNANPFEDKSQNKPRAESNPFVDDPPAKPTGNPFEAPPTTKSSNPFDEGVKAASTPATGNPFGGDAEEKRKLDVSNPFEETPKVNQSEKNPFDEPEDPSSAVNPFEDDEEDAESASGSFGRVGSSRFAGSARQKKKTAPAPPKPKRVVADEIQSTPLSSRVKSENKPLSSAPEIKPTATRTSQPENSKSESAVSTESPRTRSKKNPAPTVPLSSHVKVMGDVDQSRGRSVSHNTPVRTPSDKETNKSRSGSYASRVEQVVYNIDPPSNASSDKASSSASQVSKPERQPAIGAEAPEKPSERKVTIDIGIQATPDNQDNNLPYEFRNFSKQELVELIQRLRQQSYKKDEKVKDLEEYIDTLLLRVMAADPNLLVSQSCSTQAGQVYR